jgi:hypothetical protein
MLKKSSFFCIFEGLQTFRHMIVGKEIYFGKRVPLVVCKKVGFPTDQHVHSILQPFKYETFAKYQNCLEFIVLLINMIYY